jgi:formate hydrogenlyase subunit 6/NADH:ubiquinone oxidoreductase subunit I
MLTNDDAYNRFIDWFRKSNAYVPESKQLLPLIKASYTVQEAELLTGMPLTLSPIDALAKMKNEEPEALQTTLDEMAGRGLVYRAMVNGKPKYRPNPPRFVFLRSLFWPGRRDADVQAVAPHVTRYYHDGFGDHWKDGKTKGLRAIPIHAALSDTREIRPYEDIRNVLKMQDRFAVAHCPCRERKNTDPGLPDCKHDTENCLHFGKLADYIIENGLGREINQAECEAILEKAAKDGLVHAISNWQENVDTICNCCQCCCVYFQAFHVLGHTESMNTSSYEVRIEPESCSGCGKCVNRCPMDALSLQPHPRSTSKGGKVGTLNPSRCIGCGVCAYGCPTESLKLHHRKTVMEPPVDVHELKKRYAAERAEKRAQNGFGALSDKDYIGDISSGEAILE